MSALGYFFLFFLKVWLLIIYLFILFTFLACFCTIFYTGFDSMNLKSGGL